MKGLDRDDPIVILKPAVHLARADEPEKIVARLSSPEAKSFLIKMLCAVSKSDGMLHDTENQLLNRIDEALGMPVALGLPVALWPWEEWMHHVAEILEVMDQS